MRVWRGDVVRRIRPPRGRILAPDERKSSSAGYGTWSISSPMTRASNCAPEPAIVARSRTITASWTPAGTRAAPRRQHFESLDVR